MKHEYTTTHIGGMAFEMTLDGHHKLVMDAEDDFGGKDRGPRPKQLLISALTGCTGMDVVSILNKMKVEFTNFEIKVEADMTEEHPKVYSKIHLIYEFTGKDLQASIKQIEKAVHLSQNRYCGVADMLGKAAELTNEIRLIEG